MADKEIKDFDAVVSPAAADRFVAQQIADDVTRRMTITQIITAGTPATVTLEAIIKRLRETGGPTTLLMGAVADGQLLKRSGSTIVGVAEAVVFASGTRMVFDQDAGPTGWTRQNVTGERAIILARAGDVAQTEAGTWTVGGITAAGTAISIAQMPPHTHTDNTSDGFLAIFSGGGISVAINTNTVTGSTGGGGTHTHAISQDGTWRPANRILIVASKD